MEIEVKNAGKINADRHDFRRNFQPFLWFPEGNQTWISWVSLSEGDFIEEILWDMIDIMDDIEIFTGISPTKNIAL